MRASELAVQTESLNSCDLEIFDISRQHTKQDKLLLNGFLDSSDGHKSPVSEGEKTDNNGQTASQVSPRQKCGRPANPIPRHKRDSHIKAEYKRRDKIQKGFETLKTLVPELADSNTAKESKSAMLFKTAEHCLRLKAQCGEVQDEAALHRQELEALGAEINSSYEVQQHGVAMGTSFPYFTNDLFLSQFQETKCDVNRNFKLQAQLPDSGIKVENKPSTDMDAMYDQYVQQETNKNWKFWLFNYMMRPLYKTYRELMAPAMSCEEFDTNVIDWVKETLSLSNLRKVATDAFRKISTQTNVMSDPERLQQDCLAQANLTVGSRMPLGLSSEQELMKPPVTPPFSTHKSRSRPSSPPTGSGHKSRSRPSSPPSHKRSIIKQRRRSSNRSEKGSAPVSPYNHLELSDEKLISPPTKSDSVIVTEGSNLQQTQSSMTSNMKDVPTSAPTSPSLENQLITTLAQCLVTQGAQIDATCLLELLTNSAQGNQLLSQNLAGMMTPSVTLPSSSNTNMVASSYHSNLYQASSQGMTVPSTSSYNTTFQNPASNMSTEHRSKIHHSQMSQVSYQPQTTTSIPVTVNDLLMEQNLSEDMPISITQMDSYQVKEPQTVAKVIQPEENENSRISLFDEIDGDDLLASLNTEAFLENPLAQFETGQPSVMKPSQNHLGLGVNNDIGLNQQGHCDQNPLLSLGSATEEDKALVNYMNLDLMDVTNILTMFSESNNIDMQVDAVLEDSKYRQRIFDS